MNRTETMKTHLREKHKIESRPFTELIRAGEAKSHTKYMVTDSKQKTISAPMSYNFISLVGEEGDSADYPKHIQSKKDERDEYWEALDRRSKEIAEDESFLRQGVHEIKYIEMERYQSIDSADVLKRLRNLRENGWGTTLVIDDEDEDEDDEERKRLELLIDDLENRRPRDGASQKTKKPTLRMPPLSPGEEDIPPSTKKKKSHPTRALPVISQPPLPVTAAPPSKNAFVEEKKKGKKRDKSAKEEKKKKKKKVAGFL
jgi:hypothetical protein